MKILQKTKYWMSVIIIGLSIGVSIQFVRAWTEPVLAPPTGNIGAPVNTSATSQYKSGALGVGGVFHGYSVGVFDGNLGIGTSIPGRQLEILKDDNDVAMRFHDPNNAWYSVGIDFSDGRKFKINSGASVGDTSGFVMDGSGSVGIGTSTPSAGLKFDVEGKIGATEYCDQNGSNCTAAASLGGSGGGITGSGTANYIPKWTGGTSVGNSIIYNSGSSVGIGTTSSAGKLTVDGGSGFGLTATGGSIGLFVSSDVSSWGIYDASSQSVFLGNVGIGLPGITPGLKLDVNGKVGATEYCDQNGNNCTTAASLGGGCTISAESAWSACDADSNCTYAAGIQKKTKIMTCGGSSSVIVTDIRSCHPVQFCP